MKAGRGHRGHDQATCCRRHVHQPLSSWCDVKCVRLCLNVPIFNFLVVVMRVLSSAVCLATCVYLFVCVQRLAMFMWLLSLCVCACACCLSVDLWLAYASPDSLVVMADDVMA